MFVEGLLRLAEDLQDRYDRVCDMRQAILESRFGAHPLDVYVARLEERPVLAVVEVKQKFGGLRFNYSATGMAPLDGAVQLAETLSLRTCETCGCTGRLRGTRTLCDACAATEPSPQE